MKELSNEAIVALRRGRLIEAIKLVRSTSGLGLKEAKDAVDSYINAHPELKQAMQEQQRLNGVSQVGWLHWLLIILLILGVWYFYH